jgi:hypothetical protein
MESTEELDFWTYEQKCLKDVDSLARNGFGAVYCPSLNEAFDRIVNEAADTSSIGFGGSMTIAGLEIESRLREPGKAMLVVNADLGF